MQMMSVRICNAKDIFVTVDGNRKRSTQITGKSFAIVSIRMFAAFREWFLTLTTTDACVAIIRVMIEKGRKVKSRKIASLR